MEELAPERAAARAAVDRLRLTPVLFELGARPHPPRSLYLAYLEQSHVFVGIYWQRYGWTAPNMDVSGLEDEYRSCRDKPQLVYVKRPAPELEPRLADFLRRMEEQGLTSYRTFETPAQLEDAVTNDLALLLSESFGWTGGASPSTADAVSQVQQLPTPLTTLVGRDRELGELESLFDDPRTRLLTITGAGGTGKSRLAIEAARRIGGRLPGGAVFVDVAAIATSELFVAQLARALGLTPEGRRPLVETVVERLRRRPPLLVVDNFEHVIGAGPTLASVLAESPESRALVTSRVPLRVRGEREYRALPLPTPQASARRLAAIAASPATQLFVERARDATPEFTLTEENVAAVAEICRRLDGLPLALELAAARIRILPPATLLERLERRLDLPPTQKDLPQRQQTLRATLDWSHALLAEPERALFARLAVFAGGWTLAAAEAVCSQDDAPPVIDTLSSLVEQSLVSADVSTSVEPRFRMLETIREYAGERLADRGEQDATARRHARYFASFCEQAEAHMYEGGNALWFARLDADLQNLRAFTRWALDHGDHELVARAWAATRLYWWVRDEIASARTLFEKILPLPPTAPAKTRGDAAWILGMCVAEQRERARALFEEALALAREAEDARGTALALCGLGAVARETGGPRGAWTLHGEALSIARRLDWRWGIAYILHHFGDTAIRDRDGAAVIAYDTECLQISRDLENDHMVAMALWQLGWGHILEGDDRLAREALTESAEICMRLGSAENTSYCLDGFAGVALLDGDAARAARLAGAADGARERLRIAPFPPLAPVIGALRAAARADLGESAFRSEHAAGKLMAAEDAVVAELRRAPTPTAAEDQATVRPRRERSPSPASV